MDEKKANILETKKAPQKKKPKNFIAPPPKPNAYVYNYELTEEESRIREKLISLFPRLFDPQNIKPLAKKVHKDIGRVFKEIGYVTRWKSCLNVLRLWTGGLAYKKALIQEKHRYDLEGNPVDDVLLREKQDALVALEYFIFHYNMKKAKEIRKKQHEVKSKS